MSTTNLSEKKNVDPDCIFCKIGSGKIPAKVVYQDEDLLVFPDIKPIAKTHLLIIPKAHYQDLNGLEQKDRALFGKIIEIASKMAEQEKITAGWQLFVRVGKGGGQEVPHVHFHLVSGQHC